MRPCVIFNPAARGEKARHFRAQLDALAHRAELKPTRAPGDGRVLAADAVRAGFDTVIAAGGDGTLNEVLNGLRDADGLGRTRVGVLPLGTINVFAREFRIPTTFAAAWRVVENGHERVIDLPVATYAQSGVASPSRRAFGQLAGAGLDSRAIELVNWDLKKRFGPLAYMVAGFKALAGPQARLRVAAGRDQTEGELVLIGNGRYYGGSFELFPNADPADGRLDVTVFPQANWPALIRAGWGWLTAQIHSGAGCVTLQAETIELSSESAVPLELDGDNVGHLPATFSVLPRSLRVLTPRHS